MEELMLCITCWNELLLCCVENPEYPSQWFTWLQQLLCQNTSKKTWESSKVSQFKRTLSSRVHKVASIAFLLDLRHNHLRFTASLMNLNSLYRQRCVRSFWAAPRKWKRWFAAMKWCCLCFCHCSPVWWWFKVETNYWTKRVLPGQVPTPLLWSNRMLENQLKQIFPPGKTNRCIFAHRLISSSINSIFS